LKQLEKTAAKGGVLGDRLGDKQTTGKLYWLMSYV